MLISRKRKWWWRRWGPAIVVCAFCAGFPIAVWKASQPYPPEQNQHRDREYEQTSETGMLIAHQLKTEERHSQSGEQQEGWREKWWRHWGRRYVTAPSLTDTLLAIFTGLLAFISGRTIVHLRRTERAYVSGGGYPLRPGTLQITIDNYGKTPAYVSELSVRVCARGSGLPARPDYPKPALLNMSIKPGDKGEKVATVSYRPPDDTVYGRFWYVDIFKKKRSAGFVLDIQPGGTIPLAAPKAYTDWT